MFLEQKSIKNIEEKLEKEIKKQSLGLPIEFFIFLSNFYPEEKEEILDSVARQKTLPAIIKFLFKPW